MKKKKTVLFMETYLTTFMLEAKFIILKREKKNNNNTTNNNKKKYHLYSYPKICFLSISCMKKRKNRDIREHLAILDCTLL